MSLSDDEAELQVDNTHRWLAPSYRSPVDCP